MTRLNCNAHFQDYAQLEKEIPEPGEYTKVIFGTLNSGPWRCDRCNRYLERGAPVCFVAYYSDEYPEYRPGPEEEYFDFRNDTVRIVYQGGKRPPVLHASKKLPTIMDRLEDAGVAVIETRPPILPPARNPEARSLGATLRRLLNRLFGR